MILKWQYHYAFDIIHLSKPIELYKARVKNKTSVNDNVLILIHSLSLMQEVNKLIIKKLMCAYGRGVGKGGGYMDSVLSVPFYCDSKTLQKESLLIIKMRLNNTFKNKNEDINT